MSGSWLDTAVLYEVYPQSFADSNGDGVGDLRGVIDRLDHIASLGVDAIWFNPCFSSPFVDAGYDVADYLRIAPRYGSNEDMIELIAEAASRGIRILLDLVAGHTSIEHPWFQQELHAAGPAPDGDRYVWCEELPLRSRSAEVAGVPDWVRSPGPRPSWYLKNFYDEQPALNFGWTTTSADEPWRDEVDAAGPRRNRQALEDVMEYWLDLGVAGFRVDMAFSLVKDDGDGRGPAASVAVWQEIRSWLDRTHPDTVLIPEGVEPRVGAPLSFDADFFLVIGGEHGALFDNHAAGVLPFRTPEPAYFDAAGVGSTSAFLEGWAAAKQADAARRIILATADHDFNRLACGARTAAQLGAALMFLLTWGSVPCVYYGDEIGMRYLPGLPDVEGAICSPDYNRAGCRTPMQWDDGRNAGFSTADPRSLYLPIDPDPARPTVAAQESDPGSTLHLVRRLVALRRTIPALDAHQSTRVLADGYPLVFIRGGTHLVVVNPSATTASFRSAEVEGAVPILVDGVRLAGTELVAPAFSYGLFSIGSRTAES